MHIVFFNMLGFYKFAARVIALLIVLQFQMCSAKDVDDYELMPPLFYYENMTDCFERHHGSLYCVVKTVIKPDVHSKIWRAVEKYSKHPSYHEHSLLDRGFCVDDCVALVAGLEPTVISTLESERLVVEPYHLLSVPSEKDLPQHRARYGRILNICANHHLRQGYNLSGYSELERCTSADARRPRFDGYHLLFVIVACLLVGTVAVASYTDWWRMPVNNNTLGHAGADGLWMEFSLRRSWSRLIATPKSSLQHNFAFLEVFRTLSMFSILVIHVAMCYAASPLANMRPLEEFYAHYPSLVAVSVFPFQVHTFFTISGVLLAVHFLDQATLRGRVGWSLLWKGIVMRYVRTFPVLFLLWLYQTSWFDRVASGPGDYRFFELERDNCRANGWLNFLFLNNYFNASHQCMQQTWHLAADFQFFIIGLPFLILINRHPRVMWPLIILMTAFSVAAPVMNLMHYRLPAITLTNFKHIRHIFYVHPMLLNDYMLSHPHTCSYFGGLFAGLAYHRYRTSGPMPVLGSGRLAKLLQWVPPTMVLLMALPAPFFYDLDYSEPILWNAIYGALHRCCWGAMCAVGILYGATTWKGRQSWIHSHPVLLMLSRLSFGVFMTQFIVLKTLTSNATGKGVDFSWTIYLQAIGYTTIVCYAFALVLALFVELPAAAIFKRMTDSKSRKHAGNGTEANGAKHAGNGTEANGAKHE